MSVILDFFKRLMAIAPEVPSPPNMIDPADLAVTVDGGRCSVVIKGLPLPVWVFSNPHNTDSMDGAYDVGHTPILVCNPDFIKQYAVVGAWVTWGYGTNGRFHQIVSTGNDGQWYCQTRGLNLAYSDPYKVRLSDITGVAIGVIWTKLSDMNITVL